MISYFNIMALLLVTVSIFAIIGVLYSRGKIESMDDFLTARGTAGSNILFATFLASFLGVFILFTPPEAGSIGGISTIIGYGVGVASLYFAFLVLSPKIREYLPEGSTLNDYVFKRYGSKMYRLTVLLSIFYMFVHLVAELTSIALVAYELAEVPLLYTALLIGVSTMIYTIYGGLKASMFTDMIQMILVGILLVIVTGGVIYYGGGIGEIISKAKTSSPHLFNLTNWGGIEYGLTLCIAVFASNLFHQGYWQRIYSGKDNKAIRKSLVSCILIVLPVMLITGFFGVISAGLGLAENPSIALFSLVYTLFPNGLIIVVFILALVLVMSTVDTLLNAMVATFAIDGSKVFKNIKKESLLTFARVITVILILPATVIAAKGYSVLYLFFVADLICAGVFIPLFFGLFNKYITENIALVAAIAGIISGVPFFIANKLLIAFSLPVIISAAICVVGSNIIKQSDKVTTGKASVKVESN